MMEVKEKIMSYLASKSGRGAFPSPRRVAMIFMDDDFAPDDSLTPADSCCGPDLVSRDRLSCVERVDWMSLLVKHRGSLMVHLAHVILFINEHRTAHNGIVSV